MTDILHATFEWRCARCETVNYMPASGGNFPIHGKCEPDCASNDMYVWKILDGERTFYVRVDEIEGRRTEPVDGS